MIFKQIFRIAFVALIWKQYKAWIISTVLLLLGLYLIGQIHTDFLQHWQLQGDTSKTGQSFIYKWTAYLGSIALYIGFHYFRPKKEPLNNQKKNKEKQKELTLELEKLSGDQDPFSAIRKREKLRTRSDFILEGKDKRS